jgi:hypothetical protein
MSKASIEIPMSTIVFLIILLIVVALLLFWQLGGFETLRNVLGGVTCDVVGNASDGRVAQC